MISNNFTRTITSSRSLFRFLTICFCVLCFRSLTLAPSVSFFPTLCLSLFSCLLCISLCTSLSLSLSLSLFLSLPLFLPLTLSLSLSLSLFTSLSSFLPLSLSLFHPPSLSPSPSLFHPLSLSFSLSLSPYHSLSFIPSLSFSQHVTLEELWMTKSALETFESLEPLRSLPVLTCVYLEHSPIAKVSV